MSFEFTWQSRCQRHKRSSSEHYLGCVVVWTGHCGTWFGFGLQECRLPLAEGVWHGRCLWKNAGLGVRPVLFSLCAPSVRCDILCPLSAQSPDGRIRAQLEGAVERDDRKKTKNAGAGSCLALFGLLWNRLVLALLHPFFLISYPSPPSGVLIDIYLVFGSKHNFENHTHKHMRLKKKPFSVAFSFSFLGL